MKLFQVLLGILLCVFGASIIYDPIYHDTKHDFSHNFTEIKWPFGLFLIFIGIGFLYSSIRRKTGKISSNFLICANCLKPYDKKDLKNIICPKCGNELEALDGFYERHPEHKDK